MIGPMLGDMDKKQKNEHNISCSRVDQLQFIYKICRFLSVKF